MAIASSSYGLEVSSMGENGCTKGRARLTTQETPSQEVFGAYPPTEWYGNAEDPPLMILKVGVV